MAGKKQKKHKNKPANTTNPEPKTPGTPAPATNPATRYKELQDNELIALRAIYGEDFVEHTAAHTAWQASWKPTSV